MNYPDPQVKKRNRLIHLMIVKGLTRKQIAFKFNMTYEAVKKSLQKRKLRRF